MPKPRLNFFLPDDLKESLQRESEKSGLSMSAIILLAIREYLERQAKKYSR